MLTMSVEVGERTRNGSSQDVCIANMAREKKRSPRRVDDDGRERIDEDEWTGVG
jgi:hypothetical protein